MREFDFFAADSWRARPSLTISAGLRYVLALPFYPMNNSYTTVTEESLYGISGVGNLFKPGTLTGTKPSFVQYPDGHLRVQHRPEQLRAERRLRVAGARTAERARAADLRLAGRRQRDPRPAARWRFSGPACRTSPAPFGDNQGIPFNLTARLEQRRRCRSCCATQPSLPAAPAATYPIVPTAITNSVNMFDSNLQMPYTQSYTSAGSASWGATPRSSCATSAAAIVRTGRR